VYFLLAGAWNAKEASKNKFALFCKVDIAHPTTGFSFMTELFLDKP